MADVRPFRGLRFDTALAGSLSDLICPPYDVISAREQQALYARSPYNMVRLELTATAPGQDRYTEAAHLFQQWRQNGVLRQDQQPSLYLMRHSFSHAGNAYERLGLVGCVRLAEWEQGSVLPHEGTSAAPKQDRLALMEACRANFSPIMALYRDPGSRVAAVLARARQRHPDHAFAVEEGQQFALWVVQDAQTLEEVRHALAGQPLYLADGHHRYETALTYRDRRRQEQGGASPNAAHDFVLMTLISLDDPGLLVLPYHRLVSNMDAPTFTRVRDRLREVFSIQPAPEEARTPAALVDLVQRRCQHAMTAGLLGSDGEGPYLLTIRRPQEVERHLPMSAPVLRNVEAWVIHEAVLRPALGQDLERCASYSHDAEEAWEGTRRGRYQMAFFLRPFPLDLFQAVVGAGVRLPTKSTYFHPKLPTGLVINPLDGEI